MIELSFDMNYSTLSLTKAFGQSKWRPLKSPDLIRPKKPTQ
jgi:hypothetical protein